MTHNCVAQPCMNMVIPCDPIFVLCDCQFALTTQEEQHINTPTLNTQHNKPAVTQQNTHEA